MKALFDADKTGNRNRLQRFGVLRVLCKENWQQRSGLRMVMVLAGCNCKSKLVIEVLGAVPVLNVPSPIGVEFFQGIVAPANGRRVVHSRSILRNEPGVKSWPRVEKQQTKEV